MQHGTEICQLTFFGAVLHFCCPVPGAQGLRNAELHRNYYKATKRNRSGTIFKTER